MKRFVMVLLTLLLTACAANDAPASPSLVGTTWMLQSLAAAPVGKTQRTPSIRFVSQTQVGGSGGCNSWGGSYALKGTTIKFGQMHSTLMACEHGMDIEGRFHEMLKQARTVTVGGDSLVLSNEGNNELARFSRGAP
jgi:heat shock protein HslJ